MELKKGYKQTEVGIIPNDWEIKLLNEISNITRLAGYEYSTMWEESLFGEIIALRGFNIGKNRIIDKDFVRISNELSWKLKRSRLFKGDVIYPCVGSIGNAVVIQENDKFHIQQNIAKITPNNSLSNSLYLSHYLMSFYGLNEINKFNGSSSQPNILVGSLRKYSIILPSVKEQDAIANALSDTDAYITSLEKLIEKKRQIKQGAMQELLKPKDGWERKKMGELGKCLRGVSYNPERDLYSFDDDNSLRLLRSNNVQNSKIDINGLQFVDKIRVKKHQVIQNDDIIICMANGSKQLVGKAARFNNTDTYNYTFGAFMGCFRTDSNVADSSFVFYNFLTASYRNYIDVLLSGSSINNLNPKNIESIEIFLPKIEIQKQISDTLTSFQLEIDSINSKLEKAKSIKEGMMQNLLTGKIRLI
jgi:type I restriction enzyme S subunit